MLARLGRLAVDRRRLIMVAAAVFFVVAGAAGGGVASVLSSGGFDDPGAEASRAARLLEDELGQGEPNLVLLVTAAGGADEPAAAAEGQRLTERLAAEPGVGDVASYWALGSPPPLRSQDGSQALVLARINGDDNAVADRIEELSPAYAGRFGQHLDVQVTGFAEVFRQVSATIESDLARAELLALPITLVLLVLVFGSVVAATLPLVIGALAVVGTFLVLRLLAEVTEVSIFALNLTTAMGLGLAIDYSLFVVSRFREEVHAGREAPDAIVRTVRTAGRTVLFSAATVAASLAALLLFPLAFLRSFAYAGISVVAVAAVASVVVLPALLAALGPRVDRLTLFRRRPVSVGVGFWHRLATSVMRRPLPVATVVVVLLVLLGTPFAGIRFGLPDDRVLPAGNPARVATDELRDGFASNEMSPVTVVATGLGDVQARGNDIDRYARALSALDGVARVDALTGHYAGGEQLPVPGGDPRFAGEGVTWLSVVSDLEPFSPEAESLVGEIRRVEAPFTVVVGGASAELADAKASLFGLLPWAGALVGVVTFVVLFLMFGSLLVPAKAVVLNLLSLTATFGAMVWIFQDGHLAGLLDFTPTGVLDTTTPILMFCIAFGLSMDYEVFLLSRIKEEHDGGRGTIASVAVGLERTGRIVTAAAVLISVVFLSFATSGITFIKLFGVGLAMAVLLDASLVRATLVPAFMRLAGDANWWAPAPLARLHARFGFSESVDDGDAVDDDLLAELSLEEERYRRRQRGELVGGQR